MEKLRIFNKLIATLEGRDKLNMFIQGAAKLAFFVLSQQQKKPDMAARMLALGKHMSMYRFADRLFNSSIQFDSLVKCSQSNDEQLIKTAKMLIAFGYMLFFYYDNTMCLGFLGVLKGLDYGDLGRKASKIWFFCICLTICLLVLKTMKDKKAAKDEATQLSLYGSLCDVVIAAHGSEYVQVNDGLAQVLVILSALMGMRRVYLKNA